MDPIESSEEHLASLDFIRLREICRRLRGSNTRDVRLNQPKPVLCAYILQKQAQAQANQIVRATAEMEEYDDDFMQACRGKEGQSIGPVVAFCNYLIHNYTMHHDKDGVLLGHYRDYLRRQGCTTDRKCRDCATIKYVLNTPVAQRFLQINQGTVDAYTQQLWSTVSIETLAHSFNSLLRELQKHRALPAPRSTTVLSKAQEFGLIRMLFFVLFILLASSGYGGRRSMEVPETDPNPPIPGMSLSARELVRHVRVSSTDLEGLERSTTRAMLDVEAEAYWRQKYPHWSLTLSEGVPGSTPVPVEYTEYEHLARLTIVLRAGIREVYDSPSRTHWMSRLSWLQKLALTLSTPMSIPQHGNFPNRGGFGEKHASEAEYLRMLGTSGNFLGLQNTAENFLQNTEVSGIFGGVFRDHLVRFYSRHQDPVLDLRGEELRMGLYSTYRLYLLNFSTELHRTISRHNSETPVRAFQALVDRTWFEATSQWFESGTTESRYHYLEDLLVEVYGKSRRGSKLRATS